MVFNNTDFDFPCVRGGRIALPRKLMLSTDTWKRDGCPVWKSMSMWSRKPSTMTYVLLEGASFLFLYR